MKKLTFFNIILIVIFISNFYSIEAEPYQIRNNKLIFSFLEPIGWNYIEDKDIENGNYVILNRIIERNDSTNYLQIFPFSYEVNNEDFPVLMIYSISKIESRSLSIETFVDSIQNKYRYEFIISNKDKPEIIKVEDKNVQLYKFVGEEKVFYGKIAVLEEKEFFISFLLITKNNIELKLYDNDFISLINSYNLVSENARDEYEYLNSPSYFDYKELMKEKEENYHNYLISLTSSNYLELAYINNSISQLDTFFNAQAELIKPVSNEEILFKPLFEQEIYKLFKLFYQPNHLIDYKAPNWGHQEYEDENNEIYSKAKYILVQNKVAITIYDTVAIKPRKYNKWYNDSLHNYYYRQLSNLFLTDFAPELEIEGKKILYCDRRFLEIIYEFLGTSFTNGDIHKLPRPQRETERRLEFLNKLISIIPGHWGGYYHIESFPYILNIELNKNYEEANIFFKNVYAWYNADLKKVNGVWKMVSSGLMFVE